MPSGSSGVPARVESRCNRGHTRPRAYSHRTRKRGQVPGCCEKIPEMKNATYQEGDVFAVPLDDGGRVFGLVGRKGKNITRNIVLGFFFGQEIDDPLSLKPANAILTIRFGDLCLKSKEWPIVAKLTPWNREEWPIPKFSRDSFREFCGPAARFFELIHYDDELNRVGRQEIPIGPNEEIQGYSPDELYDALAVQIRIEEILKVIKDRFLTDTAGSGRH